MRLDLDGYVLAGGQSRRMGTPKPDLELDGTTLLQRAVRTLSGFCPEVTVVGAAFDSPIDVPVIEDLPAAVRAPLAGLYTALSQTRRDWIAILACDLPFVTVDLFHRLEATAAALIRDGSEPDAVVPVQPDGCYQPLAAIYRRAACLAPAQSALACRALSLRQYLTHIRVAPFPFRATESEPDTFLNINRPRGLTLAKRRAAHAP